MKITVDNIIDLRTAYLKDNRQLMEIYLPRFMDDGDLLKTEHCYSKGDTYRYLGITIKRDNSNFTDKIRVVYEASEVVNV